MYTYMHSQRRKHGYSLYIYPMSYRWDTHTHSSTTIHATTATTAWRGYMRRWRRLFYRWLRYDEDHEEDVIKFNKSIRVAKCLTLSWQSHTTTKNSLSKSSAKSPNVDVCNDTRLWVWNMPFFTGSVAFKCPDASFESNWPFVTTPRSFSWSSTTGTWSNLNDIYVHVIDR